MCSPPLWESEIRNLAKTVLGIDALTALILPSVFPPDQDNETGTSYIKVHEDHEGWSIATGRYFSQQCVQLAGRCDVHPNTSYKSHALEDSTTSSCNNITDSPATFVLTRTNVDIS